MLLGITWVTAGLIYASGTVKSLETRSVMSEPKNGRGVRYCITWLWSVSGHGGVSNEFLRPSSFLVVDSTSQ
ncbi:hypothetical protein B0J13DRAFT_562045 [Dactylonectria estremocensis]|uniref:Secreted protein n=1 Tax=Dactylonectria estremocensis TaxID=1079267 RepID=A0A9P9E9J0_9HYPO|nr:hypothetical protein B0J13DRAFT_562045 [Dactylonectria estremocensis]